MYNIYLSSSHLSASKPSTRIIHQHLIIKGQRKIHSLYMQITYDLKFVKTDIFDPNSNPLHSLIYHVSKCCSFSCLKTMIDIFSFDQKLISALVNIQIFHIHIEIEYLLLLLNEFSSNGKASRPHQDSNLGPSRN